MSSVRPSDAPSPRPPGAGADPPPNLANLLRERGDPLLEALERHLPGSREHAVATASYAFVAAAGMGFARDQTDVAREAAMLHDIGLIYVPAGIAGKPAEARTADETATWEAHYEAAYQLARGAGIPEYVCGWLLRVRERYDGRGPEGLAGDAIPVESRLIRAACACQTALTSATGAGPAHRVAIAELAGRAAGDLDPKAAAALIAMLNRAAAS